MASYKIKTTDMTSNRVKRNIFLALSIIGIAVTAARIFDLAMGDGEWWQPVSSAAIFACCFKFYLHYRRAVKAGILFGKIPH